MTSRYDLLFEELKVNKLPTLPHVLTEILDACLSPTLNFRQLSDIICHDSVMASKVVAVANSASYFRRNKVNSVDRAILLIGTERIRTIAMTVAIQQFFSEFNNNQTDYLKSFWRHSLATALTARAIATLTSFDKADYAYLVGLLHNIGELVLKTNFPTELSELNESGRSGEKWLEIEKETFGINHPEVGARLLEKWGLGEYAAAAVRYHHAPVNLVLDAHHLVKIIHLASHLSADSSVIDDASLDSAGQLFGLTPALTQEIQEQIALEVTEVAQSLQLDLSIVADSAANGMADQEQRIKLASQIRLLNLVRTAQEHIQAAKSLTDMHHAVAEAGYLLLGAKGARILLVDDSGDQLVYRRQGDEFQASQQEGGVELKLELKNERSLMASAVLQNKILTSEDWSGSLSELTAIDQHFLSLVQSSRLVCVPLYHNDSLLGALVLGSAKVGDLSESYRQLLRYFADATARHWVSLNQESLHMSAGMAQEAMQVKVREIIHEANNPLAIVSNYLEILASKIGSEHDAQNDLNIVREEIDRAGQILLRLKDLKNGADHQHVGVDINQEIKNLVSLFSSSLFLAHDIGCDLQLDEDLKLQAWSQAHLRQVLVNLIKNAVEAMPDGGEISIRTNHSVNVNGRHFVEIVVADNGPGIPPEHQGGLFEPGTTSKSEGHSGLGLSITRNLIIEMKGSISCRSSRLGTQFEVLLPDNPQEALDDETRSDHRHDTRS